MNSTEDEMVRSTTSSLDPQSAESGTRRFFSGSYGIKLVRFFIYNSSFGPKEGEEAKKIIFFHDNSSQDVDTQTKHVGISEAMVRFAQTFNNQDPHKKKTISTLKVKSLALEPEPGFFMAIAATVPKAKRKKPGNQNSYECTYSPDAVHENILEAVLQKSYRMFRLFTGGFQHQLNVESQGDVDLFKTKVQAFFSRYINSSVHIEKADLGATLFNGIRFQTLEGSAYLQVHSFVSRILDTFKDSVSNSMFLHQGNMVWSGLQQEESALVYHYINETLLPQSETESAPNRSPFSGHQGKFLSGEDDTKIPRLFIDGQEGTSQFHLLVYHAIMSTVCLLVPTTVAVDSELLHRLDAHMGSQLTNMSADLLDVFAAPASSMTTSQSISSLKDMPASQDADNVKFLYYNEANKAMKNTFVINNIPNWSSNDFNPEIANFLEASHVAAEISSDFERLK